MSYKQQTNVMINTDINAGVDYQFSDLVQIPHDVRAVESRVCLQFENAASRENDVITCYTVEANMGGGRLVLGGGVTGHNFTPALKHTYAGPKRVQGQYTFIVKADNGSTLNVAGNAGSLSIMLTFHREY